MKKYIVLATAAGLLVFGGFGQADEKDIKVQAPGVRIEGKFNGERANVGLPMRASKLIGAEVKNRDDVSLGKVNDIILNEKGQAHYFVITHGGVLGVGQKYGAVPFSAVTVRSKEHYDDRWIELNVSPQILEKAPTFTSDKWPEFHNGTYTKDVDTFFNDTTNLNIKVGR